MRSIQGAESARGSTRPERAANASLPLKIHPAISSPDPIAAENVARTALGSQAGYRLSDTEWTQARATILEFAITLRKWDHSTKNPKPRLGNVETPCQREP
jgi:hypothetical protein